MFDAWRDLLASKKFWTTILAVATLIAGKKGLEIDTETFWAVTGIFVSLITAQGITDHGKARLPTATALPPKTKADPPAEPPAAPTASTEPALGAA